MEHSLEAVLARAAAAQQRWKQVPVQERVAVCRGMTQWCVARADLLGEELSRQMAARSATGTLRQSFWARSAASSARATCESFERARSA